MTGEDTITARSLYREYFKFRRACKLWLSCNHRPVVRDDTIAFWRRVRCIDFPVRFEGKRLNLDLQCELHDEANGILAWCVSALVPTCDMACPCPRQ